MADDFDEAVYGARPIPLRPNGRGGPVLRIASGGWLERDLPRRRWIAAGYLMRGAVTVLAGAGGGGKSLLCVAMAVALALGQRYGRMVPVGACKVSLLNAEDDDAEQQLRLSAACRGAGCLPADLAGRVARVSFETAGLALVAFDGANGTARPTEALAELAEHLRAFGTDVLVVDPLVEMHNAGENDNQALRAVVGVFRGIAATYNLAVVLVHHARKGAGGAWGDPDMIRGAGAIVGACRVALTVCTMTEDEAAELGVEKSQRTYFFRLDGAKANYSALREVEWFERTEHTLDNGEAVSSAVPWVPPRQGLTLEDYANLVELIGKAIPPVSDRITPREERSIFHLFERYGVRGRVAQESALLRLRRDFGVENVPYQRAGRGKGNYADGLRTPTGNPAAVAWADRENPAGK